MKFKSFKIVKYELNFLEENFVYKFSFATIISARSNSCD